MPNAWPVCGGKVTGVPQRRKVLNTFSPVYLLSSAHTEIQRMHIKLINQCSKCYWHHLQMIVEETQGLSLVRVGFSSSVCFIATGQSKPQRKQCIFLLCPDSPPGAVCFSTRSQLPLGIIPRLSQAGRAKQTRDSETFAERLRTQAMTKLRREGLSAPSLKTPKSFPDGPSWQCLS